MIAEALERLTIVRAAVEEYDGENLLAGAEAVAAVNTFLNAVVEEESEDEAAVLLAGNALLVGAMLPAIPGQLGERTFNLFVLTVQHLIEHYQGVHA